VDYNNGCKNAGDTTCCSCARKASNKI